MIITNIPTYKQVAELFLKYRVGDTPVCKVRVQSNPHGEGSPLWLWAYLNEFDDLSTRMHCQRKIDGIDYAWFDCWTDSYTGTFDLDTAPFQNVKPEVYKMGDVVEILENIKSIDPLKYRSSNPEKCLEKMISMIGKSFEIESVLNHDTGVSYCINKFYYFPHYAVRKIVNFSDIENNVSQDNTKHKVTIELSPKQYEEFINILKDESK